MPTFLVLDTVTPSDNPHQIDFSAASASVPASTLHLRRDGEYTALSISSGALELAFRLRTSELTWVLGHLQPVEENHTTRQVGTSVSYIAFGLQVDLSLVVRPMLVNDATGQLAFNFALTPDARAALYVWLNLPAS